MSLRRDNFQPLRGAWTIWEFHFSKIKWEKHPAVRNISDSLFSLPLSLTPLGPRLIPSLLQFPCDDLHQQSLLCPGPALFTPYPYSYHHHQHHHCGHRRQPTDTRSGNHVSCRWSNSRDLNVWSWGQQQQHPLETGHVWQLLGPSLHWVRICGGGA